MRLTAGTRLRSAVSGCEVIVIQEPSVDGSVHCGGAAMLVDSAGVSTADQAGDSMVALGKRYVHVQSELEVLCVKPGSGPLTFAGEELAVKSAKPLPASD